jgi:hypothetical protein
MKPAEPISNGGSRASASSKGACAHGLELGENSLRSEGENDPSCLGRTLEISASGDNVSTPELTKAKVVFEKMYEIRFAGDEELMELMTWMKSHLSNRLPKGVSFLEMFKYAMRYVREREDLALRAERRKQTGETRNRSPRQTSDNKSSRHIPTRVKEAVWVKDEGRCAFVGPSGNRCNSTHNLQFDHHRILFARGGPSTADNLRLLCAKHNRHTAEQVYGKQHMGQYYKRE